MTLFNVFDDGRMDALLDYLKDSKNLRYFFADITTHISRNISKAKLEDVLDAMIVVNLCESKIHDREILLRDAIQLYETFPCRASTLRLIVDLEPSLKHLKRWESDSPYL